jgi:cytoplasmic tRNA 2-thiolation protein 2
MCHNLFNQKELKLYFLFRECFLAAATHKFRASLGKSKIVRPRDHVLIAFSGSQASTALLHLVNAGLNEDSHKRLMFACSVVYIDG